MVPDSSPPESVATMAPSPPVYSGRAVRRMINNVRETGPSEGLDLSD